jgi:hypothetical protein
MGGDLLYAGMLGYFARVDGSHLLAAGTRGDIVNYCMPSCRAVYAGAQPHYWFGIAKRVTFPGVTTDVGWLMHQTVMASRTRHLKEDCYWPLLMVEKSRGGTPRKCYPAFGTSPCRMLPSSRSAWSISPVKGMPQFSRMKWS